MKWYLVEKTSEAVNARNGANLLAKNFDTAMKLCRFSYRMEAKGIKVGREEGNASYVVPNPPPEILEYEKLLLSDIDSKDGAIPCEDNSIIAVAIPAVTFATNSANFSVELWGIDVVISDPAIGGELPDNPEM